MATGTDVVTMKAFRPSHFGDTDGTDETAAARKENIKKYAERVAAGLPLFEEESPIDRRKQ